MADAVPVKLQMKIDNNSSSSESFERCIRKRKRKKLGKGKENVKKEERRSKKQLALDLFKTGVKNKKICSGRITVVNDGMYLKGVHSGFMSRLPLTEINEARRDEDLPRLIDLGNAMLEDRRSSQPKQAEHMEMKKSKGFYRSRLSKSILLPTHENSRGPAVETTKYQEVEVGLDRSNNNSESKHDVINLIEDSYMDDQRDILRAAASFAESLEKTTVGSPLFPATHSASPKPKTSFEDNLLSRDRCRFSPKLFSSPHVSLELLRDPRPDNNWINRIALEERYIKFKTNLNKAFKTINLSFRDRIDDRSLLYSYYLKKLRQCNKEDVELCKEETAGRNFEIINRSNSQQSYLIEKPAHKQSTADAGVQVMSDKADYFCPLYEVLNVITSDINDADSYTPNHSQLLQDLVEQTSEKDFNNYNFINLDNELTNANSTFNTQDTPNFTYHRRLMF